jgi:hypothetical protein
VYDVNLLETVCLNEELPTILWIVGWGKLYDEPHLGSRILTLEFPMTFEIVEIVELTWRQHSTPRLHRRLSLGSPSGTLCMGVATRVTMRVVVTTPLTVTPSLASKPEPPPLPGTLTAMLL